MHKLLETVLPYMHKLLETVLPYKMDRSLSDPSCCISWLSTLPLFAQHVCYVFDRENEIFLPVQPPYTRHLDFFD